MNDLEPTLGHFNCLTLLFACNSVYFLSLLCLPSWLSLFFCVCAFLCVSFFFFACLVFVKESFCILACQHFCGISKQHKQNYHFILTVFIFFVDKQELKVQNYKSKGVINSFSSFSWSGVADTAPSTADLWTSGPWPWRCSRQPTARTSWMNAPSIGYRCWSMTTSPGLWLPTRGQARRGALSTCWSWTTTHMWVVKGAGGFACRVCLTYWRHSVKFPPLPLLPVKMRCFTKIKSALCGCTFGNNKCSFTPQVIEIEGQQTRVQQILCQKSKKWSTGLSLTVQPLFFCLHKGFTQYLTLSHYDQPWSAHHIIFEHNGGAIRLKNPLELYWNRSI